jgi:hypothetical protein
MYAYRNPSGASRDVVAGQGALVSLIELALLIQSKGMGRHHEAGEKLVTKLHQNFPSRV